TSRCSSVIRCPPIVYFFPYTTLFRSLRGLEGDGPARPAGGADRTAAAARRPLRLHGLVAGKQGPKDSLRFGALFGRRPAARAGRSEEQRLNSSHQINSYAVFCLKKKT